MSSHDAFTIVLGLSSALVAGLVGSFALMKRMTLAGDVISHLALPGLGLAFLWHYPPLAGAAATLGIGIILIHQLQQRSGMITESAIGVVFVAALAIGTLVTPTEDLIDALFGGFGTINRNGFILGIAGCAAVAITVALLRHQLILGIFSPDLAKSLGVHLARANFLYLCAFGLTVLLGLQFLGALLVGAMIIVPPAVARRLATTLDQFLIISAVTSMAAVGFGFAISAHWHLPLGPTIVAIASVFFAGTLLRRSSP
jgi:ABC-type Mn2+/Zn2+ transport system permease subunit